MLNLISFIIFAALSLSNSLLLAAETDKKIDLRSIPGAHNTYYSGLEDAYTSNLKMRENKKVGAGVSAGGSLGVVGLNFEFNFEDSDGVLVGFGRGEGFDSFQIGWKHVYEGDYLSPYVGLSYSRWYNSSSGSKEHLNSSILNRVLTDQEKRDGRFGTDFVNASLGAQYTQLSGEYAGLSFYGELTAMAEAKRSKVLPNGAVGLLYYF